MGSPLKLPALVQCRVKIGVESERRGRRRLSDSRYGCPILPCKEELATMGARWTALARPLSARLRFGRSTSLGLLLLVFRRLRFAQRAVIARLAHGRVQIPVLPSRLVRIRRLRRQMPSIRLEADT